MSDGNSGNIGTEDSCVDTKQITLNENSSLLKKILITSIGIIIIVGVIVCIIILKKDKKPCVGKNCCELIEYCEEEGCCDENDCCEVIKCEPKEYCEEDGCCEGKKCCKVIKCEPKEYCKEDGCCEGKKCCEVIKCESIHQCNYKGCCNGQHCCVENSEIIIEISNKINYVNIYDDVVNKTLNLEVNKIGKNRRLEEKNYYTEIKGEYLFNIYNYEIIDNSIIYYAYAALLSLNKTNNNQITVSIGGNDIRYSNSEEFPFIKFNFDQKGLISNLEVEKNYNSTLIAYIYEFINKIIPKLDKKLYEESDNNSIKYSYKNNSNEIVSLYKNENETISHIDGSNNVKNMTINIKNDEIKEVINYKDSSFKISNNFESDNLKNQTFFEETEGNNLATRNPPIRGYSEKIISTLKLYSSYQDYSLSKKIIGIINSKNLISYSNNLESNTRLLNSNISNKNELRKNDVVDKIDPFLQPFIFTYPLFNIDFLGVKIGLFSKVAFLPGIGELKIEIFYNKNGILESISNQTIYTNFDSIIDKIDNVINQLIEFIEEFIVYIRNDYYEETEKNLDIQLKTLFQKIENPPDLSNTFQTVENLFNSVMSITADCYNTIIERIENTLNYLNNLFENITQNKQINLQNIINIIKNDVNIFINDHQNDANNIYEVAKIFYQEIEEKIKNRLKEKELNNDNTPFNFDIATFYDIQDIYKKVINILSSFKERIENAIAVENLTFYNEVYNKFDEILDTPLII